MAAKTLRDSQQLPYAVRVLNSAHADPWYGPYDDTAQANLTVPVALRNVDYEAGKYYPRTVGIRTVDGPKEYWWKNNSADGSLIEKAGGGGGGSLTDGNLTTANGSAADLGGTATKDTTLNLDLFEFLIAAMGVKFWIDDNRNIILETQGGTNAINLSSLFGIYLNAPQILLLGLSQDNTKDKVLVQDVSTGKIFRRDIDNGPFPWDAENGDGTQTDFIIDATVTRVVMAFVGGVPQFAPANFTVSGATVTFDEAPAPGVQVSIIYMGTEGTQPVSDWILATGDWDDSGEWDDTENWID